MRYKANTTVYYPGCSTDFMNAILTTDCTHLVGVDRPDKYFYPILTMTRKKMSTQVANNIVLYDFLKEIQNFFKCRINYVVKAPEKPLTQLEVIDHIITAKFFLHNKWRKLKLYIGRDAETFIPPEFKNRSPDVIYSAGYLPKQKTLNPKLAIISEDEANDYIQEKYEKITTKKSYSFFCEKYETITQNHAHLPTIKAMAIRESFVVRSLDVWKLR